MKNKEDISDVQGDLFISIYSNLWKYFPEKDYYLFIYIGGW